MDYIDLSRRFRDLTESELESPELLASLNDARWSAAAGMSVGWPEILQHPRVVVLAEAGSGKTAEMLAQAARLRAERQSAFFIELESLQRPLAEILPPEEDRALDAWKAEGRSTAWFFLDAIDELKLVQGKLKDALIQFAKGLDGHLHRVHCVISCRPSDFRQSVDLAAVRSQLPFTPSQQSAQVDSDEAFLAPLRERGNSRAATEKNPIESEPRIVVLLPLHRDQISTFVRSQGVEDTAALIDEINRRDAWIFARRPGDLINLIALWKAKGRLGKRAEQHEANVRAKLADKPDRPDHGGLSDDQARSGAERLALALALTRTRTLRAPEQETSTEWAEGMLDPETILSDWTRQQREALLRRALFDPATYGRVRFHHRSVQEYLAAKRLWALRQTGMSAKSLRRLLFAERYGMPLVIPSMQAIAAWLALWDDDVRRELMEREPETLLSMGDPETLSIGDRAKLLRAFAETYGEGGWRGLSISIAEFQRLADPALASVVRELWTARPASPDVTELLLRTIGKGRIEDCADIARGVALNVSQCDHRVSAIRALIACDRTEDLREISDSILSDPEGWPDRIVPIIAGELFPDALNISKLIILIQRTHEPRNTEGIFGNTVTGFSGAMRQIVEKIDPSAAMAFELREALVNLIWQGRHKEQEQYRLRGRFDHVAPALARLCDRQLEGSTAAPAPHLIWACVVANRFGNDESGAFLVARNLKKHFKVRAALREAAFWAELKLALEIASSDDAEKQCFRAEERSVIGPLTTGDRPWLMEALRNSPNSECRLVALHALLRLWNGCGRGQTEIDELSEAVRDDAALSEVLHQRSYSPNHEPERERWEPKVRRQGLVHEGRERQRIEPWANWKEQILADPEKAFSAENMQVTRLRLRQWLQLRQAAYPAYSLWNEDALRAAFGDDIAERAVKAFQAVWRNKPPTLRSLQCIEDEDSALPVWVEGLIGLAAEAATHGWAVCLTPDEARLAAAYAMIEFSEFPRWLRDLAAAQPRAVGEVIGGELTYELSKYDECWHLPTLQKLTDADDSVKRILAPHLLSWLPKWPSIFQDEGWSQQSAHHLWQLLGIVHNVIGRPERADVAEVCSRQLLASPNGPLALIWLRGIFRFDPERATQAFEDALASMPEQERSDYAVAMFAGLFGRHDNRNTTRALANANRWIASLGRLVRCAYRYVRPAEDQEHEGAYLPDLRNDAENARNFLLMALFDTPGAEVHEVVLDLAKDPLFNHFPDRLLLLERQRAAKDAEPEALRPEDVVALEQRFEAPPNDRDSLFDCMVNRLDDLAHDIAHDDFSDRRTLRKIKDESEMQLTLARRLRDAARGAYVVVREEEVSDLKRTDIRLAATRGDQKAVIEVKIADRRWSLTDFERALRDQLVGQYLRHDTCRAGCLLLTYDGSKAYWMHPETGKRLSVPDMIEHLRSLAQAIERERAYEIKLGVCPLDLTDPLARSGPGPCPPQSRPERGRKRQKGRATAKSRRRS